MPHYLFRASYTQQGIQGVLKEGGTARAAVVQKLAESIGGRVVCQYWAFGADDYLVIVDLPDNAAAIAVASTVAASGAADVSTTVLLQAAEVDDAITRRPEYRAPGS